MLELGKSNRAADGKPDNAPRQSRKITEAQLRLAAEGAQLGLWSWDLVTGRVTWNARMYELTGSKRALDLETWLEELTHPDDRALAMQHSQALLAPGTFEASTTRIVRANGEIRWVLTVGEVLADERGEPCAVVGSTLDISDQQETLRQLEQTRRVETVGHLAAGIAHNFNNMLMVIAPCLETLQAEIPGGWEPTLADALHATDRASAIVRELMLISGHQSVGLRRGHVASELLRTACDMCRRAIPPEVDLTVSTIADSCIQFEDGALEQVITNLIFNARDALADQEHPAPTIEAVLDSEERSGTHWCRIHIRDNGPGIPAAIEQRIFDPFFTTKVGKGTGLGLATCQAILSRHGGQLSCDTQVGCTQFTLLLPGTHADLQCDHDATESDSEIDMNRKLCILLVDDEPAIQRVLAVSLERMDIEVSTASSGDELEALLGTHKPADAILLDRTLGTESGVNLIATLREHQPGARIYFFTGEYLSAEDETLVDGVIQKPIRTQALVEILRGEPTHASPSDL